MSTLLGVGMISTASITCCFGRRICTQPASVFNGASLIRAPEQADAEFGQRGPHTDVWGLAACILHLATGRPPYADLTQLQLVSAMLKRRPPEVPVSLPSWLQQALTQCLSFDTAARPTVDDLHKVLLPAIFCNIACRLCGRLKLQINVLVRLSQHAISAGLLESSFDAGS